MSMTGDYPNRSDLQNAATRQANFTGQTYGQAAQQQASQQAVPPGAPPTTVDAQRMAAQPASRRKPPTGLTAPTERPNEPLTAGAPFGPGPNKPSFQPRKLVAFDDLEEQLAILNQLYPNDGVQLLLNKLRERRR